MNDASKMPIHKYFRHGNPNKILRELEIYKVGSKPGFFQNTVAKSIATISAALIILLGGCEHGTRIVAPSSIKTAYDRGEISRHEAISRILSEQNRTEFHIYGRVIDQFGLPVTKAKVEGSLLRNGGFTHSEGRSYWTRTDNDGRFHFVGLHGIGLGIWPQKDGYFYDLKLEANRSGHAESGPNNPVTFVMWKIKGPEKLVRTDIRSRVPYDGSTKEFKLNTGNHDSNVSLKVKCWRSVQMIQRGVTRFDWGIELSVTHGSLVPENDLYPYWAPADGYKPVFSSQISSNSIPWIRLLKQGFYVKTDAESFGRVHVDFAIDSDTPTTSIEIQSWFNPAGSHNLEVGPHFFVAK